MGLGIAIHLRLGGVVEEAVETEVLLLGNRIKLVVVALGTAEGQAEEDGTEGVGAIDRIDHAVFIVDGSALAGGRVGADETAGDLILQCRFRQQVTRQLADDKFVIRGVGIEEFDDTVAIRPHLAVVVEVQSMGIGVAGGVEPGATPVFTEAG